MKLKRLSMALAACLMLGPGSLPEIADAQTGGQGRGGHAGRTQSGSVYGGSVYGSDRHASGAQPSHPSYLYFHGIHPYFYRIPEGSRAGRPNIHSGIPQGSSAGKPNVYEFSRQPAVKLRSNTPLQQATLTKHNAFFNKSKFGGKDFKIGWLDHYGHRYGYRWHGRVFWPYCFGDLFSFVFWPYQYYAAFWGYGPDVILWSAFWPYGEFAYDDIEDDSVYSGELYYNGPYRGRWPATETEGQVDGAAAETCAGFAPGVSDLPIQQLEKILDATAVQREALNDLKAATVEASGILKQSCPSETPLTPLSRLDAMRRRLQAMEEASGVLKAPLLHLYGLLSEVQKKRLEASTGPNLRQGQPARAKDMNASELCSGQAEFISLPAVQIASTMKLTEPQQRGLEKLKAISARASEELKASCPSSVPDTINDRLDAAQRRITALIQAVDTIRPAVEEFYASLTDEQKAALAVQSAQQIANSR